MVCKPLVLVTTREARSCVPFINAMSCRRKAPMLRQGSSQSSVNSDAVEPPPIPADDEPTVPSATRAPPVLRQSSSSVSSVLPTAPEENDDSAAPGRRPIGMLQRRWRAQRRREIGQKQAAIVKPEKPPVEYGIDPAAVCACCIIVCLVVAWIVFFGGLMFYGLMWHQNMTLADVMEDFHRERAKNLEWNTRGTPVVPQGTRPTAL